MRYVTRPEFVEACLFDNVHAALTWLNVGEFSIVSHDSVVINTPAGPVRVSLNAKFYVLRSEENELRIMHREAFEGQFMPQMDVIEEFTAEGNDVEGWTIVCNKCGPVGIAATQADFYPTASEHECTTSQEETA